MSARQILMAILLLAAAGAVYVYSTRIGGNLAAKAGI